jgi:exonuclease VII small subunit
MKDENIPENTKSKSIKEIKEEINQILEKLENHETNLPDSINDFQRLIILNKQIDSSFKKRFKEISTIGKKTKQNT